MFLFKLNKQQIPTAKSLADLTGFHISTIRKRLKKGMTIEEIINTPAKTKAKSYSVEDKKYSSITQLAKAYKILPETLASRLRNKWTVEEAIGLKERQFNHIKIEEKGFKNLNSVCRFYNIQFNTVNKRLERGWSLEEALELKKHKFLSECKGILYIITNTDNNKIYIGITTRTLHSRFMAHKRSAILGANTKLYRAMRSIGIDKFSIKTLVKVDNRHELGKLETVYINNYDSINNGYNTIIGGSGVGERCGIKVIHKDIPYNSLTSLAKKYNMHKDTVAWRFKKQVLLDGELISRR